MLQQQAAVEAELQARQAAADDVLQEFDRDIADPVEQVRPAALCFTTCAYGYVAPHRRRCSSLLHQGKAS
jgi:hypothetical protein